MLEAYRQHVAERAALGIPPLPLTKQQTSELVELLKNPPKGEETTLVELITHRVPAGVDDAAKVKAEFLAKVGAGQAACPLISREKATELLGTMVGGYNVKPLIDLLDDAVCGAAAAKALKGTLLMFDYFNDVAEKAKAGSANAKAVMQSWADAEWFTSRPEVPKKISVTVFKVTGETNTDDLSPAPDAWSRPDIPLHGLAMLKNARDGITPEKPGERGPMGLIEDLKKKGHPVAYVGDVVGTGSSRKSATNSVIWWTGDDIPFVPNKRYGGFCLGGKIAPIFFNTQEDAGAFPIECDVTQMAMGDVVDIFPYDKKVEKNGAVISSFDYKSEVLLDEVRAGGRINLIIGRALTAKAREFLGLAASTLFRLPVAPKDTGKGLQPGAEDGRPCLRHARRQGHPPGHLLRAAHDLRRQPGHHRPDDPRRTQGPRLPRLLRRPGDAVLLPHRRLPQAGRRQDPPHPALLHHRARRHLAAPGRRRDPLLAQPLPAARHRRHRRRQPHPLPDRHLLPRRLRPGGLRRRHRRHAAGHAGIGAGALQGQATARHHAARPGQCDSLYAIQQGLLTVAKQGKKNIFSGRILEIEGLPDLKVEQAFELTDASAERSAAGCSVRLNKEPIVEYLRSNITLMKWMIAEGYEDKRTLARRIAAMEDWIAKGTLLQPDADAEYAAVIEIDLADVKEPLLACPNDPDDVKLLSAVQGEKIDEVFIGSCMTNIGHFRAAGKILDGKTDIPTRLWVAPPTKMDAMILNEEGYYSVLGKSGARMEMPGCSLCMGNQAQIRKGSTAVSTSTRNFPNRLGIDTRVYLSSAELAAVAALMGKLPTVAEYMEQVKTLESKAADVYRYMNFDQIAEFKEVADTVTM
jgi:aconitate hydratase 2/2-methylisocitrate dehydratase